MDDLNFMGHLANLHAKQQSTRELRRLNEKLREQNRLLEEAQRNQKEAERKLRETDQPVTATPRKELPKKNYIPEPDLTQQESAEVIEAAIRIKAKKPDGDLTQEDLSKVKVLILNNKRLSCVKELEKLTQLKNLNLADNRLTDVQALEKLSQLEYLNLRSNYLLSETQIIHLFRVLPNCEILPIPPKLAEEMEVRDNTERIIRQSAKKPEGELTETDLGRVTKLNFSGRNKLGSIEFLTNEWFGNLPQLKELDLANNDLTDVEGLQKFANLELLDLRFNPALKKARIDHLQVMLPKCKIMSNPVE